MDHLPRISLTVDVSVKLEDLVKLHQLSAHCGACLFGQTDHVSRCTTQLGVPGLPWLLYHLWTWVSSSCNHRWVNHSFIHIFVCIIYIFLYVKWYAFPVFSNAKQAHRSAEEADAAQRLPLQCLGGSGQREEWIPPSFFGEEPSGKITRQHPSVKPPCAYELMCHWHTKFLFTPLLIPVFHPHQRQQRVREDHKSLYAINTTYVYGQEKYLLVRTNSCYTVEWQCCYNVIIRPSSLSPPSLYTSSMRWCQISTSCQRPTSPVTWCAWCMTSTIHALSNTVPKPIRYVSEARIGGQTAASLCNQTGLIWMCWQQYFMDSKIPCVVIAAKSDLHEVRQHYSLPPLEFCRKHKLHPPQPFTCNTSDPLGKELYTRLTTMAMYPWVLHLSLGPSLLSVLVFLIA